jgi:hypothetical protein
MAFSVPALGGTYTDRNFGTQVRVVGTSHTHNYASETAISADGLHALLLDQSLGRWQVRSTVTGALEVDSVPASTAPGQFWDAYDSSIFYTCAGGKIIRKHTLNYAGRTVSSQDWVDFSADFPTDPYVSTGGQGYISKNNWVAVISHNASLEDSVDKRICIVRLTDAYKSCTYYGGLTPAITDLDHCVISKGVDSETGLMYVVVQASPAAFIYTFDPSVASPGLTFAHRSPKNYESSIDIQECTSAAVCPAATAAIGPGHEDTYEDAQGRQYIVDDPEFATPAWQRWLVAYRFAAGLEMAKPVEAGGGMEMLFKTCKVGDGSGGHLGCALRAPWCAWSTYTGPWYREYKTITGATNASPIVITTSAAHGFVDADPVNVGTVGSNTNANGILYAKRTGYSDTTFALYEDAGLTTPRAGNGAYTSGGKVTSGTAVTDKAFDAMAAVVQFGSHRIVRRVMRSRSLWINTYSEAPFACLSPDGETVLINSNLGEPGAFYVLAAPTGITTGNTSDAGRKPARPGNLSVISM